MRRGNGIEGSHIEEGRSRRGKGEGVVGAEVANERPDGVELKVGVMGVPVGEEERERLEEEVGIENFRGMAKVVVMCEDMEKREQRSKARVEDVKIIEGLRYRDRRIWVAVLNLGKFCG